MNNLRGAKIIYQESKATQPSHLYFLQKDENYCEAIVTSESGAKRKLNFNVDLSNIYTKNETYSKIEIDRLLDAIEVTKTELDVLISENKLEPNRLYKITGVESWCFSQHLIKAIYLKAITNKTLESEGVGEFYTPKYNELDDNLGIWKGELFANGMIDSLSYNIGDKVIWGNLFWENISGEIGNNNYIFEGDDYQLNNYLSGDWQLVTPNDDESLYNTNFDIIKYDLENDYIYYREDELNNKYELPYNVLLEIFPTSWIIDFFPEFIHNVNSIALFQWGKSNVNNNFINNSIVFNCNYNTLYFKDNVILEKSIIERNSLLGVNFINNKLTQSLIRSNYIKTFGGIINNTLDDSEISSNRYYIEIINNRLSNNSQINSNNDNNIIVNNKYTIIKDNILNNNCKINLNNFVEEGLGVDGVIKSIYGNELINNCSINNNTIKNGSAICGHRLEYYSTINGNTLDTESNIYNNQLIQNGKIDNNILTGHGRIYGNQLDRLSEITLCKLRISPVTSYATTIKSNRLFTGKIQNIDFGDIVNPEGTNPNDPAFGGNELSECIIENNSIIKDLTFPNIGGKFIQFVKMNGFSEFKNITINDSITNVDFINTIFNETSDYSKLIEGSGYQTDGFTKTYIDGVLLKDAIDGKANISHTHNISDITNLQTSLDNKQNTIGYTPENVANKSDSYTVSSSTTYASTKALVDGLATKQNSLTNPITGTGTVNYFPKFTATGTIGNSIVYDNGTNIGISNTDPRAKLSVGSNNGGSKIMPTNTKIWIQGSDGASSTDLQSRISFGFNNNPDYGFYFGTINVDYGTTPMIGVLGTRDASVDKPVLYVRDSKVGVGIMNPSEKLDVNGNVLVQGLLKLKPQTSAPTGVEGAIYYNSTTKKHYGFDGTTWNALY